MSKWRPSENCLYVIPDIHGCFNELKLLLDEILPLHKDDKLIFLGDYIDRGNDTPGVIELLINLDKQYKNSCIFLRGNHEEMMLAALNQTWQRWAWFETGGLTTMNQYSASFDRNDSLNIIPKKHIKFIKKTKYYYKYDKYLFVHAGFPDHKAPIEDQNVEDLVWDRTLYEFIKRGGKLDSEYTIITGHNYKGPFVIDNFMMLDCSAQHKLIVAELNSREICSVEYHSNEIKTEKLKETIIKKPIFRRI